MSGREMKNGEIECSIPKHGKRLIDNIDLDMACGFNLSLEETDVIINYDIKYRVVERNISDAEIRQAGSRAVI